MTSFELKRATMRMTSLIFAGTLSIMAFSIQSFAATNSPPTKQIMQPVLNMVQAKKIALKAFPGKILHQEIEHEKGGSGLRYSFDIKRRNIVHEVGVDATTGKVLENDVDSD